MVVNISIIMPLYNAERYLKEALQSILKQTYKQFEVLCVNDASTDGTKDIVQMFQREDRRIRVLENAKREGAAFSRNKGMQEARGKYITFLDGDDVFEKEMLEKAFEMAEKKAVDIVIYEMIHLPSRNIGEKRIVDYTEGFIEKYCKKPFAVSKQAPIEHIRWTTSPCNKLYKKEFIDNNNLMFQSLSSANDVYFVYMALMLATKVIVLEDKRIMVYARDHFEASRISLKREPMCIYQAIKKIGEELQARNLLSSLFQHYYCMAFYCLCSKLQVTKRTEDKQVFYNFLQKEGIHALFQMAEEYCSEINPYIRRRMENFCKLDFSTGWYERENILSYYLYNAEDKVMKLIGSYLKDGKKIALWGAGKNGSVLSFFLAQKGVRIEGIIDVDEKKQGKLLDGYYIMEPEKLLPLVQVVLFSTYSIYVSLLEKLQERDIEAINIEDFIGRT